MSSRRAGESGDALEVNKKSGRKTAELYQRLSTGNFKRTDNLPKFLRVLNWNWPPFLYVPWDIFF